LVYFASALLCPFKRHRNAFAISIRLVRFGVVLKKVPNGPQPCAGTLLCLKGTRIVKQKFLGTYQQVEEVLEKQGFSDINPVRILAN
jgi:hypothetical protein